MLSDQTRADWVADAKYTTQPDGPWHLQGRILALDAEVTRLRGELIAAQRTMKARLHSQHYADEKQFREYADRHGWCVDGGMATERCASSVCDCGYEGQTWNVMRARAERAEALVAAGLALADEWDRRADESQAQRDACEPWCEDGVVLDRLTKHRRMFAHALRAALTPSESDHYHPGACDPAGACDPPPSESGSGKGGEGS